MTDKELNDYIINSFIMSFDRGLNQDFDKITLKTVAAYGTSENEFSKGLESKLKLKGTEEIYKIQLLKSGYIKVTNDKFPLEYGLTKQGEKIQELGGLSVYLKKERDKQILNKIKVVSLYIFPSLTAIISTGGLIYTIYKDDKPIEIKQPIRLQIDSLSKYYPTKKIKESKVTDSKSNQTTVDTVVGKFNK